jgi:phosphatidylserine decarboxylase
VTSWPVSEDSIVTIKGIPWPIMDLLKDSKYADQFAGGVFTHAFLNTYSYHRQHAPVDGKVVEAKVIQGQAYLETEVSKDANGKNVLQAVRRTTGKSKYSFSPQTVDAPDTPGYQFLQTRGLVVIENEKVGLVAVLPIGMAQVSSVILTAEEGVTLRKGEEISYFQFGGSDCVVVFQAKAKVNITAVAGTAYAMGKQIAIAQV